jgi:hypothetical protein
MKNVNEIKTGSDSERINQAIRESSDGFVFIPSRVSETEPERDWWLLDEAILLPSNTTVILHNCRIKLSDKCRDNFFRSANCGVGFEENETFRNIHIIGEGRAILEGADHPRSTGDGGKRIHRTSPHDPALWLERAYWLSDEERATKKTVKDISFWDIHNNTYGTDADNPEESQYGDWRNIGILFACVEDFSIENIRIKQAHGWNISLENCSYGEIRRIDFENSMGRMIDGIVENIENQDGIDIRNGCHDITISDITGFTGDDVIALTAIATKCPYLPGGSVCTTHVMHNDFTRRDPDIHDIIIRNVRAYSTLCCTIRLLPTESHIYNVVIDGVIDTIPDVGHEHWGCVLLLGDGDGIYGKALPDGMRGISISNIIGGRRTRHVLNISGLLSDSVITNIINRNPEHPSVWRARDNGMRNVLISNVIEPESR